MITDSIGSSETGFEGIGYAGRRDARPTGRASSPGRTRSSSTTTAASRPGADVGMIGRLGRGGQRADRLLQGPGEVGHDVHRDRRRALLGARGLRPPRGGRPDHAARPRQQLRQHRRREGVPGRGRGGASSRTRPFSTRSSSGCRTSGSGSGWPRWCSRARARTSSSRSCASSCRQHLAGYKVPRVLAGRGDPAQRHRQGEYPAAKEMALAPAAGPPSRDQRRAA